MKIHDKHKEYWRLLLEDGERLETIVEAFARASFETAKPAGISAITSFDPETKWETVRAGAIRGQRSAADPSCLLAMDYVAGRRCKTTIRKGRKYLTIYPGEGREGEMETLFFLAMKYAMKSASSMASVRAISAKVH